MSLPESGLKPRHGGVSDTEGFRRLRDSAPKKRGE